MNLHSAMKEALAESRNLVDQFNSDAATANFLVTLAEELVAVFNKNGRVYIAGNGGSHCDALHFAEEFTGKYRQERRPLPVLALGEASHTTCVSNDYGFEHVFSRQIEAFGREEDLLIVLSTSGNSENLILASQKAKEKKVKTVGLLGRGGGRLGDLVDLKIIVPGTTSDRIQEFHMMLLHMVIEAAERILFPENYE